PPGHRDEQEKEIGAKEPGEDGGGLEVHLRAVASSPAGPLEVRVHALPQLADEAVAAVEFQVRRLRGLRWHRHSDLLIGFRKSRRVWRSGFKGKRMRCW